MPKVIVTTGQCHVRADTKQAVYEQMEQFLDECPNTRATRRSVHRTTKRQRQSGEPFRWCGVMWWERVLTVKRHKAA